MSAAPRRLALPADRDARIAALRAAFPWAGGPASSFVGGRAEALARLERVDPVAYARTRNHVDGAVTRLSPYLRHGMLSLAEAARHAIERSGRGARKLVFEYAWRDYWRRLWWQLGEGVRAPREPAKVPLGRGPLPDDVREGRTGLACMDAFVAGLHAEGWMHNHARLWFASYVVHWRKVDWRQAADWFHGRLVDGDLASNHLSWQWVASTGSDKPYLFDRGNLERHTGGVPCRACRADCPFDASYAELGQRLFRRGADDVPGPP